MHSKEKNRNGLEEICACCVYGSSSSNVRICVGTNCNCVYRKNKTQFEIYFQRKFKVKPSFVLAVAISFFLYPFPYRLAVNLFLLQEPTHGYPAVLCVSYGGGHAINGSRLTELNHRSQIAPMSINDFTCAYMFYSSFVIIEFDFSSVNVCEDATT